MKNTRIIKYSLLSIASICAVVAIVFLTSASVAHGCSAYDNFCGTVPVNNYTGSYQYPIVQPSVAPLYASCYATPLSIYTGGTTQWASSVTGGIGSYNITWMGDEGLSGYGSVITKTYYNPGSKSASITVLSGSQRVSVNCSTTVNVTGASNYYNYNNYNNYIAPLSASCSANTSYAGLGSTVTWTTSVTGGNGYYTYNWGGTDGIYGGGQSVAYTYNTPGSKTAYVSVTSNGQTTTSYCANPVTVGSTYGVVYQNGYNVINSNTANTLDIGCYADPITSTINQPVTWNVEVTGGVAPYTYSWTGSDGLNSAQVNAIKYYSTNGVKSAIVTVTSADGKTGTRSCSNTVTVGSTRTGSVSGASSNGNNSGTNNNTVAPANQTNQNGSQLTGSAIFSFDNVPWGWIAILIILVLFATVMYLLFNRQKI